MNPSSVAKFFPAHSLASRAWANISPAHSVIDVWLSGALELRRSVDLESVLGMTDRFGLRAEVIADRLESLQDPERLFVRDATTQMGDEMSKAAFLIRAGRLCGIEMSSSTSLERLLGSVFEEYLASVSAKMAGWSMRSATQKAIAAT
jgi:hypothetical protein